MHQTIIVKSSRPTTDNDGQVKRDDWGQPIKVPSSVIKAMGLVIETSSKEVLDPLSQVVVSNAKIFIEPCGLKETDRILVRETGRVYEVLSVHDPFGLGDHVEADAVRVHGQDEEPAWEA